MPPKISKNNNSNTIKLSIGGGIRMFPATSSTAEQHSQHPEFTPFTMKCIMDGVREEGKTVGGTPITFVVRTVNPTNIINNMNPYTSTQRQVAALIGDDAFRTLTATITHTKPLPSNLASAGVDWIVLPHRLSVAITLTWLKKHRGDNTMVTFDVQSALQDVRAFMATIPTINFESRATAVADNNDPIGLIDDTLTMRNNYKMDVGGIDVRDVRLTLVGVCEILQDVLSAAIPISARARDFVMSSISPFMPYSYKASTPCLIMHGQPSPIMLAKYPAQATDVQVANAPVRSR